MSLNKASNSIFVSSCRADWGLINLVTMVRPFDLRDLALLRRTGERGVSLHAVSALVENFHPLRSAIVSMLMGGEFPTFVWKPDNGENAGFIQLRIPASATQAYVLYISPRCQPPAAPRRRLLVFEEENRCSAAGYIRGPAMRGSAALHRGARPNGRGSSPCAQLGEPTTSASTRGV